MKKTERDPAIISSRSFGTLGWIPLGFIDLSASSWSRKFQTNSGSAVSFPIPTVILFQHRALGVSVSIIKLRGHGFLPGEYCFSLIKLAGFQHPSIQSAVPTVLCCCGLCLPTLVFRLIELCRGLYVKDRLGHHCPWSHCPGPVSCYHVSSRLPEALSTPLRFPWFRKPRSTHALKHSAAHYAVTKAACLSTECIHYMQIMC